MKRIWKVIAGLAFCLILVACNPGNKTAESAKEPETAAAGETAMAAAEAKAKAGGDAVQIDFWVGLSGDYLDAINVIVDDYNASQDKARVNVTYQGSYNDCATKMQAAYLANNAPHIGQFEVSKIAPFAADGCLLSLDSYIERDGYDLDDFYEGLMGFSADPEYGTVSLPFNRSTFILYYNADRFKEAGLDPDAPPTTWDELADYGTKLTDAENNKYGFTMPEQGIYMETWVMQKGGQILNDAMTDIAYNNEIGLDVISFLRSGVKDGWYLPSGGKEFNSNEQARQNFINGTAAMIYSSSGDITTLQDSCGFEVRTAKLPGKDRVCGATGGANIAILNNHPKEELDAGWDFVKYLCSVEATEKFAQSTGYLPVRKSVIQSDTWNQFVKGNPNFATPLAMLETCDVPRPYHPAYAEFFTNVENNALSKIVLDLDYDGQKILNEISDQAKLLFD